MNAANAAVNLSTVYGHLPLTARAAAAKADGFVKVESWWDFESATPPSDELDAFAASIEAADVHLIAMNSHAGERARGERGLASLPDRQEEFQTSIASVVAIAERLGARKFNVTVGNRDARFSVAEQEAAAAASYRFACSAVAPFGGTILVEPLSAAGAPDYPFRTGYDVVSFLRRFDLIRDDIGVLFDTFHLAENGVDLGAAWRDLSEHVRHVQLADSPGRGAPGTGSIDFTALLAAVSASDYRGDISLEHMPATHERPQRSQTRTNK